MSTAFVKNGSLFQLRMSDLRVAGTANRSEEFITIEVRHRSGRINQREFCTCQVLAEQAPILREESFVQNPEIDVLLSKFVLFQQRWIERFHSRFDASFDGGWKVERVNLAWRWIKQRSIEEYHAHLGIQKYPLFDENGSGIQSCIWISGEVAEGRQVSCFVPFSEMLNMEKRQDLLMRILSMRAPIGRAWRFSQNCVDGPWEFAQKVSQDQRQALIATNWRLGDRPKI